MMVLWKALSFKNYCFIKVKIYILLSQYIFHCFILEKNVSFCSVSLLVFAETFFAALSFKIGYSFFEYDDHHKMFYKRFQTSRVLIWYIFNFATSDNRTSLSGRPASSRTYRPRTGSFKIRLPISATRARSRLIFHTNIFPYRARNGINIKRFRRNSGRIYHYSLLLHRHIRRGSPYLIDWKIFGRARRRSKKRDSRRDISSLPSSPRASESLLTLRRRCGIFDS